MKREPEMEPKAVGKAWARNTGGGGRSAGKLLYQGENGWAMYDWAGNDTPARDHITGNESFLVHACDTDYEHTVREVYIFPDTHKACWRCRAPLPDGMKGLWIMHNGRI